MGSGFIKDSCKTEDFLGMRNIPLRSSSIHANWNELTIVDSRYACECRKIRTRFAILTAQYSGGSHTVYIIYMFISDPRRETAKQGIFQKLTTYGGSFGL